MKASFGDFGSQEGRRDNFCLESETIHSTQTINVETLRHCWTVLKHILDKNRNKSCKKVDLPISQCRVAFGCFRKCIFQQL